MRMSGGLAWYGDETHSLEELVQYADFAMYQGKNSTKGELREFDKAVYLQESFMLNGSEALMRPQSDVIDTPIKLLKIATLQSQLYKVEKLTINKTFESYVEHVKLFVNSIPNEILKAKDLDKITKKYSSILGNIVVEITEGEKLNMLVSDRKVAFARSSGMLIALDDYGSGYCSNLSLLSMKPDIIKMDQMMIKNISNDKNRQAMLQQILSYAKEKNIAILAEGVETYEDMKYLVNMKVDYLQGYYVSRPTPLPDYNTERIKNEINNIKKYKN